MTWIVDSSGTAAPTVGVELDLVADAATNGTQVLEVDLGAMVAGDTVRIRVLTRILAAGTMRQVASAHYAHVQTNPIKLAIPVPMDGDGRFTARLTQRAGTARTFPWKLLRR